MRVMLMVQNGDKVTCASRSVGYDPAERLQGQEWLADSGFYVWWTARGKAMRAERWWLVEAESANEARVAIEYARLIPGSAVFESMKDGHKARILASGGRS